MKIVSSALLPVVDGDLRQTLTGFVSLLRDHCSFDPQTRFELSLTATPWKFAALVARALPSEAGEFETFLPDGRKMTAAAFLARTATSPRPDKASCSATLTDFLSRDQTLAVLSELAAAVPVSGRGVGLMLFVHSVILHDASVPVRGRMDLVRWRRLKARCGGYVFCEFEADSKSSPVVKKTLQELRDAFGLEWRKPVVQPDLQQTDRPSASEMAVIGHCIREAFARAAADLDRAQAALSSGPHLYSPTDAAFKRMRDITGGIHEKIDFLPEVRQFMRVNFPDYVSCSLGGSVPSFRKRLAEHLDGLLMVPRSRGFGKCFTLDYYVDFPGTRFAGQPFDKLMPSASLSSLFHQGWLPPEWAYARSEDLAQAFDGCRDVLQVALPVLEARLTELLSPAPAALPQDIETRGRLSAREAHEQALGIASAWALDATFIGVHSCGLHPVDPDGRLQSQGCWLVRYESRQRDSELLVEVPHSGQIGWNSMARLFPLLCAPPSQDWLDSPGAVRTGIETIKGLAPDEEWDKWECGIVEDPTSAAVVWEIHASFRPGPRRPAFRDAHVFLNPVDGSPVRTAVYER
jgi:hypothetical protein